MTQTIFGLQPAAAVVVAACLLIIVMLAIVALTRPSEPKRRTTKFPKGGPTRRYLCLAALACLAAVAPGFDKAEAQTDRIGPNDSMKWTQPATNADGSRPIADMKQWEIYLSESPDVSPTSAATQKYIITATSPTISADLAVEAPNYGAFSPALTAGVKYACVASRDLSGNLSKCSPTVSGEYDPALLNRINPSTPVKSKIR
jgi:hypothetical protein